MFAGRTRTVALVAARSGATPAAVFVRVIAMDQPSRAIGFVVYDDANLLDVSGPLQVFATATEQIGAKGLHPAAYSTALVSAGGGAVETSSGVPLTTASLPAGGGEFDTVIVAGGHGAANLLADRKLIKWLRDGASRWRRTASVCTGSLLLAKAGLLDGRRAATHWDYCERFQRDWPGINVEPDAIFVNDGPVWTSAGVSSGMDMALAMVEADWGRAIALLVARRLLLYLKRPGGQSQFSVPLKARSAAGRIGQLLDWIVANPAADCRVGNLAARAAVNEPTLHRAFLRETGLGPAEFVEHARVENARRMLEESDLDFETLAIRSGFRSAEQMRRALVRAIKVSPLEYRARFRTAQPAAPLDPAFAVRASRLPEPAY